MSKSSLAIPAILDEELVTIPEARRSIIPKTGDKPICAATVRKWINQGVYGVRLEVVYVGGIARTSAEAVRRFLVAVTERRLEKQRRGLTAA